MDETTKPHDGTITTLEPILASHPFLKDLDPHHLHLITECASNARFSAGEYLLHEGDEATHFYLIRAGNVALEVAPPNRPPLVLQTVGEGEVVGWSWFFPPYRWHFDARAITQTRAIAIDAECLRHMCDDDPVLGYRLARQFASIQVERLQAAMLQLIDMYGKV